MRAPAERSRIHHMAAAWHRPPTWTERNFRSMQARYLREIEAYHLSKGWAGIGYQLVVFRTIFGRTVIYEGRGVGYIGAHTAGENSISLGVSVVGNYETQKIQPSVIKRLRELFDHLHDAGHLQGPRTTHPTGGHRDAPGAATACPGRNLYAVLNQVRRPL